MVEWRELVLRMEMSANVTQDRAPYEQRYTTLHSQSIGSAHNRALACAATFRRSETISSACSKARWIASIGDAASTAMV
jgi:hypothetical protein